MNIKSFVLLLLTFSFSSLNAQFQIDWIEILEDQVDGKIELYAINTGLCPVTVSMGFKKLTNLQTNKGLPVLLVIPNDGEEHLIVKLARKNNKQSSEYEFDFTYAIGNTINTVHDDSHVYTLPFQKGKKSVLGQGYHGKFSHYNIKALDFSLKEGTEVLAARAGTVIAIKEDSHMGCKDRRCKSQANYILIYHEDGTFGSYVHLKKNGAKIKEGDQVEAGQVIGYSGNTGWSSGPHLHFEVYIPEMNRRKSVETKFQISEKEVGVLKEKQTYFSK